MKPTATNVQINLRSHREAKPVPVVWDALIATQALAEGKFIPLVILDTTDRPDIEEMVRAHRYVSPPGDVTSRWGRLPRGKDTVALILEFVRPAEITLIINFHVAGQGALVDQILRARALYIQPGRPGDRLVTTMDRPRIIVEVGHLEFEDEWNRIFLKAVESRFRREGGLRRKQAREAAGRFIHEFREFGAFRMNAQRKSPN